MPLAGGEIADRLLPEPLIRVKAPAMAEATVMRQGKRTIVHMLHYCPQRRTPTLDIVEDVVPFFDVEISLKTDREPGRVYTGPINPRWNSRLPAGERASSCRGSMGMRWSFLSDVDLGQSVAITGGSASQAEPFRRDDRKRDENHHYNHFRSQERRLGSCRGQCIEGGDFHK